MIPFFLVLFSAIPALNAFWNEIEIDGGKIKDISAHDGKILAAGENKLWLSKDSAENWIVSSDTQPAAAVITSGGRAYFAGKNRKFYKSEDYGQTWTETADYPSQYFTALPESLMGGLACDIQNSDAVYFAGFMDYGNGPTEHSIYKSEDGGNTWNRIFLLDDSEEASISSIIAFNSGKLIFSLNPTTDPVSNSGRIYFSSDYGENISEAQHLNYGFSGGILSLTHNSLEPSRLYASTYNGEIHISEDGGENWTDLNSPEGGTPIYGILFIEAGTDKTSDKILAFTQSNVYLSQDGGINWDSGSLIDPEINSFLLKSAYDGSSVYIADTFGAGIYKNQGDYSAYSLKNKGIKSVGFSQVIKDYSREGLFYALSENDIYFSTDSAQTWNILKNESNMRQGGYGESLYAFDGKLYFAAKGYLKEAVKNGEASFSWSSFKADSSEGDFYSLAKDPQNDNVFYAAGDNGLFKISDMSLSENMPFFSGKFVKNIFFPKENDNSLMIALYYENKQNWLDGDSPSLAYSINGGEDWDGLSLSDPLGYRFVNDSQIGYFSSDFSENIYVCENYYAWKISFSDLNSPQLIFSDENGEIKSIKYVKDSGSADSLIISKGKDIYISLTKGDSWSQLPQGLYEAETFSAFPLIAASKSGLYKTIWQVKATDGINTSTFSLAAGNYSAVLTVPPSAFPAGTALMITPSTMSLSDIQNIKLSQIKLKIENSAGIQPSAPLSLTVNYSDSDISGLDEKKLKLFRAENSSSYSLLESSINESSNILTGELNHLSIFVIAQYSPSSTSQNPLAYPVPYNPDTHISGLNFENIYPNSRVKIFNIAGELIADIRADNSGKAVWKGKNNAGNKTASGVYLALTKDLSGSKKIIKFILRK